MASDPDSAPRALPAAAATTSTAATGAPAVITERARALRARDRAAIRVLVAATQGELRRNNVEPCGRRRLALEIVRDALAGSLDPTDDGARALKRALTRLGA